MRTRTATETGGAPARHPRRLLPGTCAAVFAGAIVFPCAWAGDSDISTSPAAAADLAKACEGGVIGDIAIRVDNVFDLSDPREDRLLYRLANALHVTTHESAITAQLLFAPGDPYSPRKLEETERALRANGYLAAASVRPVACDDGEVDVEVAVRDVWSLTPELAFGRQGGRNKFTVSIEDPNFLGTGKLVQLKRGTTFDRTTTAVQYFDPNLFGSRWRMDLGYADNSDGGSREFDIDRPFFALDTPWSANLSLLQDERETPRYSLGHEIDSFRVTRDFYRAEAGRLLSSDAGWIRRLLFGVTHDSSEFFDVSGVTPAGERPVDRRLLYPWLGWEIIEDQYAETSNLTQIGRVEDLFLGTSARVTLGYSPANAVSPAAAIFSAQARTSHGVADAGRLVQFAAGSSGRWGGDGLENALLDASVEYFQRASDKRVWYARLGGTLAQDLDADYQLLLGGDSGLRGYPLRYQAGTASALFTLEHRYFTNWYPFRLFNVGAAVFVDAGRTWGSDVVGTPNLGLLTDVGFGLRLGNSRSSHGAVIHLDVAFPLDRANGIDSVQFLVQTRKSF